MVAVGPAVFDTAMLAVAVHPFASVIVTTYAPAARLFAVAAVPPDGAHEYEYPPAPPDGFTVADPELDPQFVGVDDEVEVIAVGSVMFAFAVAVHPLASVIVTVYVPAPRLDSFPVVPPLGDQE